MQRIHSIGDGRLFVDDGGGDRRLRHHHHHHHQNHQHHHQALQCPRCDSLNTKFCYYNNYNLSQPRHFCKNCRRYWTKGGVLRNVPVGGGSRKSKRSDNKSNNNNSSSSATSETASATTLTPQPQPQPPERNSNSHSSSESSTRTAAATATEAMSNTFSVSPAALELEQVGGGDHRVVFSETGSVTSLVTSTSTNEALAFGFGNHNHILDASSFRFGITHHHGNDHLQAAPGSGLLGESQWHQQQGSDRHHEEEFATASLLDHAVPLEFPSLQNKAAHGGFGPLDWHAGADHSLFDLPVTVDQPYWTYPHWSEHDNPPLFHLP